MFENVMKFFKKFSKENNEKSKDSKDTAKERLHLVLMQDRANVSADFLELMKQEIIEVIKKYIDIDENQIDVRLTNKVNSDGTNGAPALYANIPIMSIKDETRKITVQNDEQKQEKAEQEKNENNNIEESTQVNGQEENKEQQEEHKEEPVEAAEDIIAKEEQKQA